MANVLENLTADQKVVICIAINRTGTGEHPFADTHSLPFFELPYVRECLRKAVDGKLFTTNGAKIAKKLLEVL